MQAEYTAPSLEHIEHMFCQSCLTRGIFRQFVYTIFAYSEQLIHHAISSQSSYRHQSSILQSSQLSSVITLISLYIHLIYSHHITLTSYHIIRYVIHYPVIHYPLPSLHTLSFTYHIPPSYPTTQLSYLLFAISPFVSSPYSLTFSSPLISPLLTHSPSFPLLSFVSIHIPFHITYIHSFSNLSVRINFLSVPYFTHLSQS